MEEEIYVSECCGAYVQSNGDMSTMDISICPDCKEHCEYVLQSELD